MAYTIAVVALILDHQAAAAAINEPADYFDNDQNDRYDGVERLQQLTGADIEAFSYEDGDIYYVGIQIESEFYMPIDAALLNKALAVKQANSHPLVQSATLAVVGDFN